MLVVISWLWPSKYNLQGFYNFENSVLKFCHLYCSRPDLCTRQKTVMINENKRQALNHRLLTLEKTTYMIVFFYFDLIYILNFVNSYSCYAVCISLVIKVVRWNIDVNLTSFSQVKGFLLLIISHLHDLEISLLLLLLFTFPPTE